MLINDDIQSIVKVAEKAQKMNLYWYRISGDLGDTWVGVTFKLLKGQFIAFKDTVGRVERQKDGSWSAIGGLNKFIRNEPSKEFAIKAVRKYFDFESIGLANA